MSSIRLTHGEFAGAVLKMDLLATEKESVGLIDGLNYSLKVAVETGGGCANQAIACGAQFGKELFGAVPRALKAATGHTQTGPDLASIMFKDTAIRGAKPGDVRFVHAMEKTATIADAVNLGVAGVRLGLKFGGFASHALMIAMTVIPGLTIISAVACSIVDYVQLHRLGNWYGGSAAHDEEIRKHLEACRPMESPLTPGEAKVRWAKVLQSTDSAETYLKGLVDVRTEEGRKSLQRVRGATSSKEAALLAMMVQDLSVLRTRESLCKAEIRRLSGMPTAMPGLMERLTSLANTRMQLQQQRVLATMSALRVLQNACQRARWRCTLDLIFQLLIIPASFLCMTGATLQIGAIATIALLVYFGICLLLRYAEEKKIRPYEALMSSRNGLQAVARSVQEDRPVAGGKKVAEASESVQSRRPRNLDRKRPAPLRVDLAEAATPKRARSRSRTPLSTRRLV